jgi:hypothetical protein
MLSLMLILAVAAGLGLLMSIVTRKPKRRACGDGDGYAPWVYSDGGGGDCSDASGGGDCGGGDGGGGGD